MGYNSYQHAPSTASQEKQQLVGDDGVKYHQPRRNKRSIFKAIQCFCGFVLALFVLGAVLIVVGAAIRTRDIRNHEMIAKHQIALLNSRKTHAEPGFCNSTLVLIRHCDKNGANVSDVNGDQHCSALGFERADYLAKLFGEKGRHVRWTTPSFMYALSTRRPHVHHSNFREIETLTPLAKKSHVDIDAEFSVGQEPYLADEIFDKLASGLLCGNVTVVCWKHSRMPSMSASLGCGENEGCPAFYPRRVFGQVWTIEYAYEKPPEATNDSTAPLQTRYLKKGSKGIWTVHGKVESEGFDSKRKKHKHRKQGK